MKRNPRYVFDTNVIISALLIENSTSGQAFFAAHDSGEVLVSLPLLTELSEVLARPKFDRYVARADRARFLESLIRETTLIEVTEVIQVCRDPKDDMILELAVAGEAACIVSGDKDLLILSPFRDITILPPREFLAVVGSY